MSTFLHTSVTFHTVTEHETGQRVDNFLLRHFKKVPKSLIYRIVRKGEVRVNKKRVKAEYKLQLRDEIRIPPVKIEKKKLNAKVPPYLLKMVKSAIHYEDTDLMVLDKPSGLAVHGGSHSELGIIEIIRELRTDLPYLELVHRLDMETSGLLMLAKSRSMLLTLHTLLRDTHKIKKHYTTLILGEWKGGRREITHILERKQERSQKVQVSEEGKVSTSIFTPLSSYKKTTLMDVQILTGRMHQIRSQLAHLGHPIIGDDKYGSQKQNQFFTEKFGSTRLFLHASRLSFETEEKHYSFEAPLPEALQKVIDHLERKDTKY